MKKKVGIIGYGTIGKYIYEKLSQDEVEVVFVYGRKSPAGSGVANIFISSKEQLENICRQGLDLVIETATSQAVAELAPVVLKYADMVIFSTTALADQEFYNQITQVCQAAKHKLYIPHGAILGLDGIVDGKNVLQTVTITTTKKPANLGRTDTCRTVLYDGPTREVCKMYPRNVNVHAAIALAGLGFDKTQSKIISDPDSPGNTHAIEIKAEGCQFTIQVLSKPISGVTGAYTPVSAYSSVHRILFQEGFVII